VNRMARGPVDRIESAMETALAPGRFISDGASYSFVRGLEEAEQQISGIIEAEPDRAVALYEAGRRPLEPAEPARPLASSQNSCPDRGGSSEPPERAVVTGTTARSA